MRIIGIVMKASPALRAALALLLVFALYLMPNAALAQAAKPPVPPAQTVASPADANATEIEELREQTKSAVFDKTVAEAKLEVIAAGKSTLTIVIACFGLLNTVLLFGFGVFTYRKAASEAAKAVKEEFKDYKDEIEKLVEKSKVATGKIEAHHAKVVELTAATQALIERPQSTTEPRNFIPQDQQKELENAAKAASEIPRDQRTAQDFRILMFQAQREENWQDYVNLAEGMAYLHGDDPDDLAFALFGKAIGQYQLKNYELASIYWADYFTRCPDDDEDSRASALNNWGAALSDQAPIKQGADADALYAQAAEKYAAALAIKPDSHEALYNWGAALLAQAGNRRGKKRAALLDQAEEKQLQAEKLMPGSGAYNLACAYGLRGDAAQAADWLKKAKDADIYFPNCAHIAADADFDTVRDAPEFVQALKDTGC